MYHLLFRKSPLFLSIAGFITSGIYYFTINAFLGSNISFEAWSLLAAMLFAMGFIFGLIVRKLYYKVYEDALTGLHNKGYLYQRLVIDKGRFIRKKTSLSLIMFDLDNFKTLNDTYGHIEGDKALAKIGAIILENIRDNDTAFRFGGDEFVIILPNTTKDMATQVAYRLKEIIRSTSFTANKLPLLDISFGIMEVIDDISIDDMIRLVDEDLYKAKREKLTQSHY